MITFESRHPNIKSADLLMRCGRNMYPHSSTSQIRRRLSAIYPEMKNKKTAPQFLNNLNLKLLNMRKTRKTLDLNYFLSIINSLKYARVGNCFEEAELARIVGLINGQESIKVGSIIYKDSNSKELTTLDHAVAFIVKKNANSKVYINLDNKDAIIIDPWLGISDWAGNYFSKIRNEFQNYFPEIKKCKDKLFGIYTYPKHAQDCNLDILKDIFPELVLKNYKPIKLD